MVKLFNVPVSSEIDLIKVARVCTGNEDNPCNVGKTITRLIRDQHWSVFEHASMSFVIEAPIYVMRQWMRHKGAWMEKSRRYTKDGPEFERLDWADEGWELDAYTSYTRALDKQKSEDARKLLPMATMTKCIWTADLRAIFHFLRLRLDSHAQKEIRQEAIMVAINVKHWYPHVFEAWIKHDFLAINLPEGCSALREVDFATEKLGYRRSIIKEIMERAKDVY